MHNIRAILFDMDDTLINRPEAVRRTAEALGKMYFPDDPAVRTAFVRYVRYFFYEDAGTNRKRYDAITSVWPHGSFPAFDDFNRDYDALYPTMAAIKPCTDTVLHTLTERGYRLGMVTNGTEAYQTVKIRVLGFGDMFSSIRISEIFGGRKPDPAIFLSCAGEIGVPAEECAFIGDNPLNDIEGARRAGMVPVWLRGMMYWDEALERPPYMVQELDEILPLFPGCGTML